MSDVPEWMQKFKQIGQRGDESVASGSVVATPEERKPWHPPKSPRKSDPEKPSWIKEKEEKFGSRGSSMFRKLDTNDEEPGEDGDTSVNTDSAINAPERSDSAKPAATNPSERSKSPQRKVVALPAWMLEKGSKINRTSLDLNLRGTSLGLNLENPIKNEEVKSEDKDDDNEAAELFAQASKAMDDSDDDAARLFAQAGKATSTSDDDAAKPFAKPREAMVETGDDGANLFAEAGNSMNNSNDDAATPFANGGKATDDSDADAVKLFGKAGQPLDNTSGEDAAKLCDEAGKAGHNSDDDDAAKLFFQAGKSTDDSGDDRDDAARLFARALEVIHTTGDDDDTAKPSPEAGKSTDGSDDAVNLSQAGGPKTPSKDKIAGTRSSNDDAATSSKACTVPSFVSVQRDPTTADYDSGAVAPSSQVQDNKSNDYIKAAATTAEFPPSGEKGSDTKEDDIVEEEEEFEEVIIDDGEEEYTVGDLSEIVEEDEVVDEEVVDKYAVNKEEVLDKYAVKKDATDELVDDVLDDVLDELIEEVIREEQDDYMDDWRTHDGLSAKIPDINSGKARMDDKKSSKDAYYSPTAETDLENQHDKDEKRPGDEKISPRRCLKMSTLMLVLGSAVLATLIPGWIFFKMVFIESDDSPSSVAPPRPTDIREVGSTTPLDPVQAGDCNFEGLVQPHVIDQCACNGMITTIAEDVLTRYQYLRISFIPTVLTSFTDDISSCSAQNQALVWLSTATNNGGEDEMARRQRFGLAAFFLDSDGINWADSSNWLSPDLFCSWYGVTCNSEMKVQHLALDMNDLSGTLSSSISLITGLESFSAFQNDISGSIPPEIIASGLLSLDLSGNRLTGPLPEFAPHSAISKLNVEANMLTGSIPATIVNARSLASFNIGSNNIIGTIPSGVFDLPLKDLSLHANTMTGSIPNEISRASTLVSLRFGPNFFSGRIPPSISDLSNLEVLSFQGIKDLTGRIPESIPTKLTNLVELTLSETSIGGDIPPAFGRLTKLEWLDLSNNELRGVLPTQLGQLTQLYLVRLNNNRFAGGLPTELGELVKVQELLLNDNALTGRIPTEVGRLLNLRTLRVDGNVLTGRAATEVCDLREARLVDLVVDCAYRDTDQNIWGIVCAMPTCCSACRD